MGAEEITLQEETITLFKRYCGIDVSEIKRRGQSIRAGGLQIQSYRCIDSYRFLFPRILSNPFYKRLREKIPNSRIFDIGCAFGTDLRQMVVDGANPELLYGFDIHGRFIRMGFDLFRDHTGAINPLDLKLNFLAGNLNEPYLNLIHIDDMTQFKTNTLDSAMDLVHAGSVLHLLSETEGEELIKKINHILKSGGIFIGRTSGASEKIYPENRLTTIHSPKSLKELLTSNGFAQIKIVADEREVIKNPNDAITYFTLHFLAYKAI